MRFPSMNVRRSIPHAATSVAALLAPLLAVLSPSAPSACADEIAPAPFSAGRYQKMFAHSPFAPPTGPVIAAPLVPGGLWTDKLAVTAIMQYGSKYIATVLDRDSSQTFLVTSDKVNDRNMMLSNVQWNNKVDHTRVTIRRGTEFGQVAFDPSANAAPAGGAPGGENPRLPAPPIPGAPIFHPPPGLNSGPRPLGQAASSRIVRRTPNTAFPAPLPTAPGIQRRVTPAQAADDDDDDDN